MPYIRPEARHSLDARLVSAHTSGELNYQITTLCLEYLSNQMENYQTYNDIIGVLECAKLELYHRCISAYERQKAIKNGDVYTNVRWSNPP